MIPQCPAIFRLFFVWLRCCLHWRNIVSHNWKCMICLLFFSFVIPSNARSVVIHLRSYPCLLSRRVAKLDWKWRVSCVYYCLKRIVGFKKRLKKEPTQLITPARSFFFKTGTQVLPSPSEIHDIGNCVVCLIPVEMEPGNSCFAAIIYS